MSENEKRVLVVDDVEVNLFIAQGLLELYGLQVDTAMSGFAVLDKIKENGEVYDIIFMDHMMPRMDGIAATVKLREFGYTGVIVALTANAMAGSSDMFIKKGFDGFVSKPIDMVKLDDILNQFMPGIKRSQESETPCDGKKTEAKMLRAFGRDAQTAVVTLRQTLKAGDFRLYVTTAHAMKSALANIGRYEESQKACDLEKAGKNNDIGYISANTDSFIKILEEVLAEINARTDDDDVSAKSRQNTPEDTQLLNQQLQIVKAACEDYDLQSAQKALEMLEKNTWSGETKEFLTEIQDLLYSESDFEGVAEKIEEIGKK